MNNYKEILEVFRYKIAPLVMPMVAILAVALVIRFVIEKPKNAVKAESDGVKINFTNKEAAPDANRDWKWTATLRATRHSGETITAQYGVYWCKTSSGSIGEGNRQPCAADLSPNDYLDTLIFENRQLLIQNTSFEITHRGVNCGRIQIDIGGFGGILGGDTYDTGISCIDRNIPVPAKPAGAPTPTSAPGGGTPDTTADGPVTLERIARCLTFGDCSADTADQAGSDQPNNPGQSNPQPTTSEKPTLDYSIPFRDSTVQTTAIAQSTIVKNWPHAKMNYWDVIVSKSIANGWNPALVLALWIEETGGSTATLEKNGGAGVCNPNCSSGHLGCHPGTDQTLDQSLACVFNNFNIPGDQFDTFMRNYCGPRIDPICDNNPNFVRNLKYWYSVLVPSGHGSLVPK